VGVAERQREPLHPLRVLVEEIAQVGGRGVGGGELEQHDLFDQTLKSASVVLRPERARVR
jgi:hypothetical protein